MSWLRVDDAVADAPDVLALGDDAFGALVRLAAYSARHLTDGVIPVRVAIGNLSTAGIVSRLVQHAMLVPLMRQDHRGRQRVESYCLTKRAAELLNIRPATEVRAEREAAAARQKAFRNRRRNGVTDGVTHARPDPTRPDPTRPGPRIGNEEPEDEWARGIEPGYPLPATRQDEPRRQREPGDDDLP